MKSLFLRIFLSFWEKGFTAKTGKNGEFFLLSFVFDQDAIGADLKQLHTAKFFAYFVVN